MWLLSAARAELKFFNDPDDVSPPGFCILSHTWGRPADEQTFQDVQKICEECKKTGENPRKHISDKVRKCCELAVKDGYEWVWIDTCCINKESSSDLSEAINSMFRYYSLSGVCYAYLADVPDEHYPPIDIKSSAFVKSKWHQRGWTLQELIAPKRVAFFSQSWTFLGTKAELAKPLEKATGIPEALLCGLVELTSFSVAQRMSWAARRETSRKEDEAYCLLGIFNINMPTLYGEGSNAFYRLQKEIVESYVDTTIFAWHLTVEPLFHDRPLMTSVRYSLFADSPIGFVGSHRKITFGPKSGPEPQSDIRYRSGKNRMTFTLTPHGVLARVPSAMVGNAKLVDFNWYIHDQNGSGRIYLNLTTTAEKEDDNTLWYIGGTDYGRAAVKILDNVDVSWQMEELYISDRGNDPHGAQSIIFPKNCSSRTPFQFHFCPSDTLTLSPVSDLEIDGAGGKTVVLDFNSRGLGAWHLTFGICTLRQRHPGRSGASTVHWFRDCLGPSNTCLSCREEGSHSCETDHFGETGSPEVYFVGGTILPRLLSKDILTSRAIMRLSVAPFSWVESTLSVHGVAFDGRQITPPRPLTHTLDVETNRVLLHTDSPFPNNIAGHPIFPDPGAVYLGSAVIDSRGVFAGIRPCWIELKNRVPKIFRLDDTPDRRVTQHFGYYYLLALDDKRMHWISWKNDGPSVWDHYPVIGGWLSDRKLIHAIAHQDHPNLRHYVGYLVEGASRAFIAHDGDSTVTSECQVLCWRKGVTVSTSPDICGPTSLQKKPFQRAISSAQQLISQVRQRLDKRLDFTTPDEPHVDS